MKDWDDLRYFLAVARNRSLAGAARAIGVNHSTAFRRLGALEAKFQTRLFERLPEGYVLTTTGETMLPIAEQAEEAMLRVEREILGRDVRLAGDVRVTAPANIAIQYLAPLLPEFGSRYPEISIDLAVGNTDFDLGRREADLAVRATAKPPLELIGRKICDITWHACAAPGYWQQHGRPDAPEQLGDHRLIGGQRGLERLAVFRWLRSNYDRSIVLTSNDLSTMRALIQAGAGIGFLPSDQTPAGFDRLFTLPQGGVSGLWLLTHPDLRSTARVRALSAHFFDALSKDRRLTAPSDLASV